MRWIAGLVAWTVLLPVSSSQDEEPTGPQGAARAVIEKALDAMQAGSLRRESIDWSALRREVLARAATARTVADAHPALEYAVAALGDGHSFLVYPGATNEYVEEARDSFVDPSGEWLASGFALVRVPGYLGGTGPEDDLAFARKLQRVVAELDARGPRGWIVDLRGDTGGNMWPMLLGIGPVLGDGHCGAFVGAEGHESRWFHREGQVGVGDNVFLSLGDEAHVLARPDPWVAVLTGPDTASSGEALATAFSGRPRTRSFGRPTAGVSTANDMIWLAESTLLFLCVARNADRTGRVFGDEIPPDVLVEDASWGDAPLQAAVDWLASVTVAPPVGDDVPPAGLSGRWAGAAVREGVVRLLELEFAVDDGALTTQLTQPYDGYTRFAYDFRYEDGWLRSGLWGEMALLVDLDQDQLRGTVSRDGQVTHTVFLQRVLAVPRPLWREEQVRFEAGRDTLAGTLVLPETAGPHPALVHVTGRGYGTRWNTHALATRLARFGVAGLVFDGRGSGDSTGDRATVTDADRFEDVHAARKFLAGRADLRQDQIGLIGGSAGGWVVPIVAAERDDVAFLITTVGPAEDLVRQQGHVIQELMKRSDVEFEAAELQAAYEYTVALVELSARQAPWSEFEALMAPARDTRWWPYVDQPEDGSHPEVDYFRRRPGFDPVPALRRTTLPMLAVYGEDDHVVPPEHNVPALRRLLTEAGNTDFEIVVLPGADHALARPGAIVGEGEWPWRFERSWTRHPQLDQILVDWLLARVDVAPR